MNEYRLSRRAFLKGAGVSAATVALAACVPAVTTPADGPAAEMSYRSRTGGRIPRFMSLPVRICAVERILAFEPSMFAS